VAAALVLPLSMVKLRGAPLGTTLLQMLQIVGRLSVFVVPTVVIYLIVNKSLFDTAVPVSGIAKMIGGPLFSNWGIAFDFFARWKSLFFLLIVLLPLELLTGGPGAQIGFLARRLHRVHRRVRAVSLLLRSFDVECRPWYSYLVALDMALIAGRIVYLGAILAAVPRFRSVAVVAAGVLCAWGVYRGVVFIGSSLSSDPRARASLLSRLRSVGRPTGPALTSFNQLSVDMLRDFFATKSHTVIAMGDRAGGSLTGVARNFRLCRPKDSRSTSRTFGRAWRARGRRIWNSVTRSNYSWSIGSLSHCARRAGQ